MVDVLGRRYIFRFQYFFKTFFLRQKLKPLYSHIRPSDRPFGPIYQFHVASSASPLDRNPSNAFEKLLPYFILLPILASA